MTRGRERGTAPILSHGQTTSGQCGFNQAASTQPTPSSAIEHAENAVTRRQCSTQLSAGALDLLENGIGAKHNSRDVAFALPPAHSGPERRLIPAPRFMSTRPNL